jgi:transcriptional regulator with XRE-family HTH domain
MVVKVFGKVLSELRKNAGLSQEKLAELAGLDRTYISLLERGLRQPTITTLGISPSSLIKDVENRIQ